MQTTRRFMLALTLALLAAAAHGQEWPVKPVRIINPFPAGGGTDTFARPLAAKLTQALGQQFLIENQGGAGGTLGAANAAKALPDGYTLLMGAVHHTIAESLYTKLPYRLERDFIPVTLIASVPQVIVIHPKHGTIKMLKDLLDYAKANPGKLNFGSAGNGTAHHLAGELFKTMTGVDLVHVPYKGAGPLMVDLIAGQVDMAFDGMGTSSNQIRAGKLVALAVAAGARTSVFPNMPTVNEAGVPGYEVTTWYAIWALRGTPTSVVDRLYLEIVKILQQPDIKEIWASQVATAGGQRPTEFGQFVSSEITKWSKVVKDSGAKIDN
ncbi:MAG: tripartite tricarboxylate transporter substrate binding protein [Betaproteobacteria bacterium]|nr:tripartite tricarboxylate transporter substrate binding protein [Betaproteobacteria bacterium]